MSNNNHFYCIIMAGGIGSRFWPISRESRPKQFLNFSASGKSFLKLAYDRLGGVVPQENILVVSLTRYHNLIKRDLPDLDEDNMILEPYNRNTAPCIAYAAYTILKRDPKAVMVAIPADQVIDDTDLYRKMMEEALNYAFDNDQLITLGIVPTRPDSNFGYIQMEEITDEPRPVKVKTFTEKPDNELAKVFVDSGEFLWNSGIVIAKARVIAEEMEKCAPEITRLWAGWETALGTAEENSFIQKIYTDMPRISFDYAVLEKSPDVITYPSTFGWADIGNWDSFYEYLVGHDVNGNAVRARGKSLAKEDKGSIIYSTRKDKLIAVRGLEDFIVVDTDDVLMICPRDEKKLKEFISELAMPEYEEYR